MWYHVVGGLRHLSWVPVDSSFLSKLDIMDYSKWNLYAKKNPFTTSWASQEWLLPTLFHSSFCFITFFNGFFGAGISVETLSGAIVDRNGKWPLALGERFLGVELGITFPQAHGTVSGGQASVFWSSLWPLGFIGAGTPGVKNKGVADQLDSKESQVLDGFQTEGLWKILTREWYHLRFCFQNEIHPGRPWKKKTLQVYISYKNL